MHWLALAVASIGFQQVTVDGMAVDIWYPSAAPAVEQPVGLYRQTVATDGAVRGAGLPLVVISHGVGGSAANHYDLAMALVHAGYVVAAVTHPGDNYRDQSAVGQRRDVIDRPRHIHRLIDYMLTEWPARDHLDRRRIGVFGFSLGGFTALVVAGGVPDLRQTAALCHERPDAPECAFIAQYHGNQLDTTTVPPSEWVHDPRVGAVVLASPAALVVFRAGGLRDVRVPVQIWRGAADPNAPEAWNAAVLRTGLPTPPDEHVVGGAGHFVFTPLCAPATMQQVAFMCTDPPGVDRAAVHRTFEAGTVAFFNAHLTSR